MNVSCSAKVNACPVLLSSACVFYEGENLIYTGINTNDTVETALEKIDARFANLIFTVNVIAPLQKTGTVNTIISIPKATSLVDGYLSSTDWSTFNSKQNQLNGVGFVKANGTTITYDNSTYYLASNPNNFIPLTALSSAATGLTYTNTTGVFTLTPGYVIPTTTEQTNWNTAYNNRISSLTTTGSSGAATLLANVLNIPNYTLAGLGGVPTTRTLTINGTTFDLSANRTWTIPSDNIYNSDGTLTGARTLTSGGFGLTILGGKELVVNDQTALQLKTSTTGKQLSLYLINTNTTTGKTYELRSETDGTFRIRDLTQTAFLRTSSGKISIGNIAPVGNADLTLYGYTNSTGILKVTGASGSVDGNGLELFFTGNTSYANSFDRAGSIWRNLEVSALATTFRSNGSTSMTLTAAGRLLLGTTTEGTNTLEVAGSARISGNLNISNSAGSNNNLILNYDTTTNQGFIEASTSGVSYRNLVLNPNNSSNVGIGITPTRKFDVNGTSRYLGEIFVNTVSNSTTTQLLYLKNSTTNNTTSVSQLTLFRDGASGIAYGGIVRFNQKAYSNASLASFTQLDISMSDGLTDVADTTPLSIRGTGIGINNTSPNASAMLDVASTTKGFLQPRLTTVQRDAIASPATGLQVYNTTTNTNDYYNGTAWVSISSGNIYTTNGTLTGNREVSLGGYSLQFQDGFPNLTVRGTSSTGGAAMTFFSNTWPYGFKIGMYSNAFGSGMNDKASLHMMNKDLYFTQSASGSPSSADITMAMFQATRNISIGSVTDAGFKLDVQGTARVSGGFRNADASYGIQTTIGTNASNSWQSQIFYNGSLQPNFFVRGGGNTFSGATSLSGGGILNAISASGTTGDIFAVSNGDIVGDNTALRFVVRGNGEIQVANGAVINPSSRNFAVGGNITLSGGSPRGDVANSIGGNAIIRGGLGTGSGASGDVIISTATPTTAGTTIQTATERFRVFGNTGNVLIQNGGTFTDAGFKLDVNGTSRVSGTLNVNNQLVPIIDVRTNAANGRAIINISDSTQTRFFLLNYIGTTNTSYDALLRGFPLMQMPNGGFLSTNNAGSPGITDICQSWFQSKSVTFNSVTEYASAQVAIDSTTKGFLPPRMTTTQRDAIASPATGLQVYNTTTNTNDTYNGTSWISEGNVSGSGVAGQVAFWSSTSSQTGSNSLFWDIANSRLGIGNATPEFKLDVTGNARFIDSISIRNINTTAAYLYRDVNVISVGTASQSLEFGARSGSTFVTGASISGALEASGTSGLLQFSTLNASTLTERMRITSAGRLLIGTVSESTFLLDVNGTARITGNSTFVGTANFGNWLIQYSGGSLESTTSAAQIYYNGPIRINGATQQTNIGAAATGSGISIGSNANAGANNISIGISATTTSGPSVAIGHNAIASQSRRQLAIGANSSVLHHSCIALNGAVTTAPNQFVAGVAWFDSSEESPIKEVYFGSGVNRGRFEGGTTFLFNGNGESYSINGSGAAGTDFAGGDITIAGGKGTGSGASGDVIISTATPVTSGTTLQTLTNRARIKGGTGQLVLNAYTSTSSFSGTAVGYLGFDSSGNVITVPVPSSINIYNSNGSLDSARTVTIGDHSLAFSKTQTGLTGADNFVGTSIVSAPTTNASITWTSLKGFFNYQGIFSPTFGGNITFQNSNYAGQELKINRITFAAASSAVTMTQASGGVRAFSNAILHNYIDGTNSGTITHFASLAMYGDFASSSAKFTFGNRYGLLINDFQEYDQGHTYVKRWAIYQAGADDNNYFKGKVVIGSTDTVGVSPLNVKNLPTSSVGLAAGDIWNNGGVLNIV